MKNFSNKYILVILMLAATTCIVSALQYNSSQDAESGRATLQSIPLQIGEWQGFDMPLDEKVYEILETRAIIHRNYVNRKGETVLLSIVHYHDTKVDFHAPAACLGGRGEHTEKYTKNVMISSARNPYNLEIAEILASNANGKSVSYYFYKAGTFMGQNYFKMRLHLAKNSLSRGDKSGSLIRFSGYLGNEDDQQKIEKLIESFMQTIIPAITG